MPRLKPIANDKLLQTVEPVSSSLSLALRQFQQFSDNINLSHVYYKLHVLQMGLSDSLTETNTGLFKTIVGVQFSSGNSASNSRSDHHLTVPFEDGMHIFKRQGACVSGN